MKIKCLINGHDWVIDSSYKYDNQNHISRTCSVCNKYQVNFANSVKWHTINKKYR